MTAVSSCSSVTFHIRRGSLCISITAGSITFLVAFCDFNNSLSSLFAYFPISSAPHRYIDDIMSISAIFIWQTIDVLFATRLLPKYFIGLCVLFARYIILQPSSLNFCALN
jgi:hypothetical protein